MRFCPQIASAVDLIAFLPYHQAASKETSIKASLQPAQPKARSCWQQVSKQLMRGHSVERKHPVKLDQNSSQLGVERARCWCICLHACARVCVVLSRNMEAGAARAGEPAAFGGFRPNIGRSLPNPIYCRCRNAGSLVGKQLSCQDIRRCDFSSSKSHRSGFSAVRKVPASGTVSAVCSEASGAGPVHRSCVDH